MRKHSCLLAALILVPGLPAPAGTPANGVSREPHQGHLRGSEDAVQYGIVIEASEGKKVDCPTVFRHRDRWYMVYVQLEPPPLEGYTTQLAESDNLLQWKPLGTILARGDKGAWDQANAAGGVALFNPGWGRTNSLQTHEGRYWMSYIGGKGYGYEAVPLKFGIASTADPSKPQRWSKLPAPILTTTDRDVRPGETGTLYKTLHPERRDEVARRALRDVLQRQAAPGQREDLRGGVRRLAAMAACRHGASHRESRRPTPIAG